MSAARKRPKGASSTRDNGLAGGQDAHGTFAFRRGRNALTSLNATRFKYLVLGPVLLASKEQLLATDIALTSTGCRSQTAGQEPTRSSLVARAALWASSGELFRSLFSPPLEPAYRHPRGAAVAGRVAGQNLRANNPRSRQIKRATLSRRHDRGDSPPMRTAAGEAETI
jgi:hypothetical protein